MNRPLSTPPRRSRCAGFTLIELLAVIVIISMLMGIAVTAAQWVFRTARVKRYELTCRVLESAAHRYRHEYAEWPIPEDSYKPNVYQYTFSDTDNKLCFSMLRQSSEDNPKGIQFIDESAIFVEKAGKVSTLAAAGAGAHPFVYRNKKNQLKYFTVMIDVDAEKVKVN